MEKTKHTREKLKTEATNNVNERADNKEDPFRRLPNELLFSIFSRLADLKSLCRYSLVSKHFAKVISGVQTVSITLSGSGTYPLETGQSISRLMRKLQHSSVEQIPELLELLSLQKLKLPSFLQKLRELESIYLDYEYPQKGADSPFPMWNVKFVGNSAKIKSLVALVPAGPNSIRKGTEYEPGLLFGELLLGGDAYFDEMSAKQMNCFWSRYYGRYSEWLCFILVLIKSHTSLRRVTISDSEMHSKLVVGDEQLAYLECNAGDEFVNQVSNNIVRVARVPVLPLPLSGYVMIWASLVIIHAPDVDLCTSFKKLDKAMFRDSGDELKGLREAVKEVFKNHRDNLRLWGSISASNY